MLTLKNYQQRALDTLKNYFRECARSGDPNLSFYKITLQEFGEGIPYRPVAGFDPQLPYVCLRVPTGGGKTLMACYGIGLAASELLHADRCLVLWLVPSNAIRDQTLKALRDREHPYRLALESTFGPVTVLDVDQALYLQRPTLDTETTIIVSTLQAFRVDDTDGRRVYDENGALTGHFTDLSAGVSNKLQRYPDGAPIPSLANVLCLRRPVVIVDEAHNARTPLSFDTLARFDPACIIELTATPNTTTQPSNVLHSVSAAELQAEDMIKMPIRLETRTEWKELVHDAVVTLRSLEQIARAECDETGEYLRPVMLLQAQPRRKDEPTLTVEVVKQCLLDDERIPENQIAIATGSQWELDNVHLASPTCLIRYIITIQALREGWDCPFAYVLCTVADLRSATYVEQILGRVMRLPNAKRKTRPELNLAYAFAAQTFAQATSALTEALIESGFERQDARDLITRLPPPIEDLPLFANQTVTVAVPQAPDLSQLPPPLAARVTFDAAANTLTFQGVMSENDRAALTGCFYSEPGQSAVERAFRESQGYAVYDTSTPAERGVPFSLPVLAIRQGDLLEEFEATHLLEEVWSLTGLDVSLSEAEFAAERPGGQQGEILIGEQGHVTTRFIADLQAQMVLLTAEPWNAGQLLYWLERNIPHSDLEPDDMARFLERVIRGLQRDRALTLDYLVHDKYKLRAAVEDKIQRHRAQARQRAYQHLLLPASPTPLVVRPDLRFHFDPSRLPPYHEVYRGSYQFHKHYYKWVGDLKPQGDEFECAQFIDNWTAVEFWVRNPVKTDQAFSLQTSTDRFYPDFVCQLKDGRTLVVEYKSERDWTNEDSIEKRTLGELWEARSDGKCLFIMPKGKDWGAIKGKAG